MGGLITEAIQPALEYDSSDEEYLLSAKDLTSLNLFSINTSGTPTLNVTNLPIPMVYPADWAAQPGTSDLINTSNLGGENVLSPVLRNGSLWCTQAASNMNGPDGVSVVRWYEIQPAAIRVKQWGNIFGAGAAYYGAITVLDDGEVFLTYSTSSSSQYASAAYASRAPNDPQGAMPIQGIYQDGQSYFTGGRWGDLSGISPDPDGTAVWGLAQYAGNYPDEGPYNYGTALVKLLSRHDQ